MFDLFCRFFCLRIFLYGPAFVFIVVDIIHVYAPESLYRTMTFIGNVILAKTKTLLKTSAQLRVIPSDFAQLRPKFS